MRLVIPYFGLYICCSAIFLACKPDNAAVRDPLANTTGKPSAQPAPTPVELPIPSAQGGNFEGLVADYESKDRGIWQKPDMVISLLGDLERKTVADIGAGTGYFAFRILPKAKKVLGIDIDRRFINFMDSVKVRLPQTQRTKFESRLARPDDPTLKPGEADAVIIVNTYGYIENRVQYLKRLSKGISPGGQLLIIDFKKNNLPVGPKDEFKVSLEQLEKELTTAGYSIDKIDKTSLDYQYIVLANNRAGN